MIKGCCQSGRKVVTHNSKSDLPLASCQDAACIVQRPEMSIRCKHHALTCICRLSKSVCPSQYICMYVHTYMWGVRFIAAILCTIHMRYERESPDVSLAATYYWKGSASTLFKMVVECILVCPSKGQHDSLTYTLPIYVHQILLVCVREHK